jgi:predicted kinase
MDKSVPVRPTLHLTTGLPGVGKTTLARRLARDRNAVRLSPDEWMQPLFGESDAGGRRDILEGRLIWVAYRTLLAGTSVILDFGCWSAEERFAIRAIAAIAGAEFELHYLQLSEDERRARAATRWRTTPGETFEMTASDHDRFLESFDPPSAEELAGTTMPKPPSPWSSWTAWAADRWPTLPNLDHDSAP